MTRSMGLEWGRAASRSLAPQQSYIGIEYYYPSYCVSRSGAPNKEGSEVVNTKQSMMRVIRCHILTEGTICALRLSRGPFVGSLASLRGRTREFASPCRDFPTEYRGTSGVGFFVARIAFQHSFLDAM